MKKIIALQGIPCSGKSTFARNLAINNPKEWVIVSRDSIRESLGQYWVPERENLISDIEESMIYTSIMRGFNVIIDATNLNPNTILWIKDTAKNLEAELEFKSFEVDLRDAIERDKLRIRPVGEKVIRKFHKMYKNE